MKEDKLKDLIKSVEHKTSANFTDSLMSKIEQEQSVEKPLPTFSVIKLIAVVVVLSIVSGIFLFQLCRINNWSGSILIPVTWSFLILFGCSQIITLHKQQLKLKNY